MRCIINMLKPKIPLHIIIFRRIEKIIEKPRGSGKFRKATPWRDPQRYTLKDGEEWLDTWSIAEKAPKKGSVTFDHEPTADELAEIVENECVAINDDECVAV